MRRIRNIIFIIFFLGNSIAYSLIRIGVSSFAPPYSTLGPDNHYYGFSIDLMNAICKNLNETCEYKVVPTEEQFDALDSGAVDLILWSNPMPQVQRHNHVYSIPYATSDGEFVTLNPNIKSITDLKSKRVGIIRLSSFHTILLPFVKEENIREYDAHSDLLLAIKNNDVDALLVSADVIKYFIYNQVINLHIVGKHISLGNGYGIVALPKNKNLINVINEAIIQIENNGAYENIYSKYFGN